MPYAEDWHYIGATDEPAFENGWENATGSGFPRCAYRIREAGLIDVHIGAIAGTSGATMFTLPAGYRPAHQTIVTAFGYTDTDPITAGPAVVTIGADGTVTPFSGLLVVCAAGQAFLNPPEAA